MANRGDGRVGDEPGEPTFDEFIEEKRRRGEAVPPRPGRRELPALERARLAVEQQRDLCRRILRDGVDFDFVARLVESLPPLRREGGAKRHSEAAALLRLADRSEVWTALGTGAAVDRGRDSDWPESWRAAFGDLDIAVGRFEGVLAEQRSAFPVRRSRLVEDFLRAYEELRRAHYPPPAKLGRPPAAGRELAIRLLRELGVAAGKAVQLAQAAGMSGAAQPRTARSARRKAAVQRRNERRTGDRKTRRE